MKKNFPSIPEWLGKFEFYNVSIPTTILLWIMIYPMMLKIDFKSIKDIGKNPKGLFITWFVNWIIKPLSMYLISSLFFFIIYKGFINKPRLFIVNSMKVAESHIITIF